MSDSGDHLSIGAENEKGRVGGDKGLVMPYTTYHAPPS